MLCVGFEFLVVTLPTLLSNYSAYTSVLVLSKLVTSIRQSIRDLQEYDIQLRIAYQYRGSFYAPKFHSQVSLS